METTILIILVAIIIFGFKCILVVPACYAYIVERLGKYHNIAQTGVNLIIPLLDCVKAKIYLGEQNIKTPPLATITSDNKTIWYTTNISFQIANPEKATYEIASIPKALSQITITVMRDIISKTNSDNIFNSSHNISLQLCAIMREGVERWGLSINFTEVSFAKSADSFNQFTAVDNSNDFENSNVIEEFK